MLLRTLQYYILIDAEKGFNRLEWDFIKTSMEKWGMDLLYNKQSATIQMDGARSAKINIQRGVHQGCLMFPLLFKFAIDIMAIAIRSNPDIKGI